MFIYEIKNKTNNKRYIGQTCQETNHRLYEHKSKLRSGIHENRHLQRAWNKFGEELFEFSIIEYAGTIDQLNLLEEKYMNQYKVLNRNYGYNIRFGGNNRKLSEETKLRISKSKTGIPVHTEESKRKISKFLTGKPKSEETRRKLSESLKGYVWPDEVKNMWALAHRNNIPYPILISPDNKEVVVENMTQFCKGTELSQQAMSRLVRGKHVSYKGWTIKQSGDKDACIQ